MEATLATPETYELKVWKVTAGVQEDGQIETKHLPFRRVIHHEIKDGVLTIVTPDWTVVMHPGQWTQCSRRKRRAHPR